MGSPPDLKQTPPIQAKGWESVEVFHEGDSFFNAIERSIDEAQRSIDFETYIFASDRVGHRIFSALARAASRGIEVRLLVDAVGSSAFTRTFQDSAVRSGVLIKVYNELPWRLSHRVLFEGSKKFWRFLRRLNKRTHRKLCVIDREVAFVGSINVTDYHLPSVYKDLAWRDTAVKVRGPDVEVLAQSFDDIWGGRLKSLRRRFRRKRADVSDLIRLNVSARQRRESYLDLLVRLVGAQKRIWIANAYFVPDGSLLRVLGVVARENVDVRILVPAFSDVVFMPWVASAFHLGLLGAGVRVFEYHGSVLHAKTMLIDDWGLIGSSNLNHRSLLHDLEVDLVVSEEEARRSLETQFLKDLELSREVTIENWRNRPWIERLIGRILLWVRYLL